MLESNTTNIIPPRVELVDPRTGLISREWYRFFLNLFTKQTTSDEAAALNPASSSDAPNVELVKQVEAMELAPNLASALVNYLQVNGGTLSGPLRFLGQGAGSAVIEIRDGAYSKVLVVDSAEGVRISAPFVALDTQQPALTMVGGQRGSPVVVSSIDAVTGAAILGYEAPPTPSYSVEDTQESDVLICPINSSPPTTPVNLGLALALTQAVSANTATFFFECLLDNPGNGDAVCQFRVYKNGIASSQFIDITITENFHQTVSFSAPISAPLASGDTLELYANATEATNNASITMIATPSAPARMRLTVAGSGGSVDPALVQQVAFLSMEPAPIPVVVQPANIPLALTNQVDFLAVAPATIPNVVLTKNPISVTVGASPFTYVNTAGYDVDVIISGGGVMLLEIYRNGTWYHTGQFHGMFRLSPFDRLRVTSDISNFPIMTVLPR